MPYTIRRGCSSEQVRLYSEQVRLYSEQVRLYSEQVRLYSVQERLYRELWIQCSKQERLYLELRMQYGKEERCNRLMKSRIAGLTRNISANFMPTTRFFPR
jgi:hypothetical protein